MGGTTAEKFIGQMIDKIVDRSNDKIADRSNGTRATTARITADFDISCLVHYASDSKYLRSP